jgi:hypothetical protein
MNSTPCHDWIPIDQVTPENCPDGSRVTVVYSSPFGDDFFYTQMIHWVDGDAIFLDPDVRQRVDAPDAVLPCTK